jgi:hypothetical protein
VKKIFQGFLHGRKGWETPDYTITLCVCACEITHNEMPFTKIILLGVLCYAILSFLHEWNSIEVEKEATETSRKLPKGGSCVFCTPLQILGCPDEGG